MPTITPAALKAAFAAGKYPTAGNYSDLVDYIGQATGGAVKTISAYENTTWSTLVDGQDLSGAAMVLVTVEQGSTDNPVKITYEDNGSGQSSWVTLQYGNVALFTPTGQPVVVGSSATGHTIIPVTQSDTISNITDIFTFTEQGKVVFLNNTTAAAVTITDANSNVLCTIQPGGVAQFVFTGSDWKLVGVPIQ